MVFVGYVTKTLFCSAISKKYGTAIKNEALAQRLAVADKSTRFLIKNKACNLLLRCVTAHRHHILLLAFIHTYPSSFVKDPSFSL
jgi:hypothetical protein